MSDSVVLVRVRAIFWVGFANFFAVSFEFDNGPKNWFDYEVRFYTTCFRIEMRRPKQSSKLS